LKEQKSFIYVETSREPEKIFKEYNIHWDEWQLFIVQDRPLP
jgi:hypothetical protein